MVGFVGGLKWEFFSSTLSVMARRERERERESVCATVCEGSDRVYFILNPKALK